jgi:vesicle coat complex subunit
MNDIEFSCKCIETIGDIVLKNSSMEIHCIRTLIMLLKSAESEKVAAAVVALRKLLCNVKLLISK